MGKHLFTLKNSKGDRIKYFSIDFEKIKALMGFSGGLEIVINSCHGIEEVAIYHFSSKVLKADERLRSLLFGRANTNNTFIGNETTANTLGIEYSSYIVNYTSVEKLEKLNSTNKGIGAEYVNENYKHGTAKQDKNQKIDVIDENGKRWQTKTSVASKRTNWSYSITNGSAL